MQPATAWFLARSRKTKIGDRRVCVWRQAKASAAARDVRRSIGRAYIREIPGELGLSRRRVVVFQVGLGLDEIDTVIKGTWRHGGPVRGMHGWQTQLMGWRVCTLKPTRWHTCALEALDQLHCLIVVCMAAGCLKLSHGKSIRSNEGT